MATVHKLPTSEAEVIVNNPDTYVQFVQSAYDTYAADVMSDIRTLRAFQSDYPEYYAKFCIVTAIMSNGMQLEQSFYAAHAIVDAMMISPNSDMAYDDVDLIVKSRVPSAGSLAYGSSIKYIAAQWQIIAAWMPNMMDYGTVRTLDGMGPKTGSWAIALHDHNANVFTLDRWMLRGIAGFPQTGNIAVSQTVYNMIADMMLAICDMLEVSPLVAQWSMWNTYRNNEHADHTSAVPEWYRLG